MVKKKRPATHRLIAPLPVALILTRTTPIALSFRHHAALCYCKPGAHETGQYVTAEHIALNGLLLVDAKRAAGQQLSRTALLGIQARRYHLVTTDLVERRNAPSSGAHRDERTV
jgi:hypothetical protein